MTVTECERELASEVRGNPPPRTSARARASTQTRKPNALLYCPTLPTLTALASVL